MCSVPGCARTGRRQRDLAAYAAAPPVPPPVVGEADPRAPEPEEEPPRPEDPDVARWLELARELLEVTHRIMTTQGPARGATLIPRVGLETLSRIARLLGGEIRTRRAVWP